LSESDTLVHVYSLALIGLLQRANWKNALFGVAAVGSAVEPEAEKPVTAAPMEAEAADEAIDVRTFLEQLKLAQTHYDVLGVSKESSPAQMKMKYYELARRYHPDRYRKSEPTLISRLESAFARITQAYDTLRDDTLRANYDAKLRARQKAQQLADAAATKTTAPVATTPETKAESAPDAGLSVAQRAERQFKEGLEALELGQRKVAVGLFAAAASAVPKEARYRAHYGRLLAEHEHTRRAAEAELQAAIKLDPQNGEYRVLLAQLYRDLGLMLRARGEAERAVEADPNNAKARDLLRALKSV
jgi:curved DNA-binding protein CbpA